MSIAVYILSASVVGTGTLLGLCVRKCARELAQTLISTANVLNTALSQHQNAVVSSVAQHQSALATNSEKLEQFSKNIPTGATVHTHVKDTNGARTLRESHTVEFK